MKKRDSYTPIYGWVILIGLIVFGGYLLWEFGLFSKLLTQDKTYLSTVILLLFVLVCGYLGWCAWVLSRQADHAQKFATALPDIGLKQLQDKNWLDQHRAAYSWALTHYRLLTGTHIDQQRDSGHDGLQAHLIEQVHRGHSSGWFLSDVLLRLGLIGTVIGFVLMLGSVYELKQEGIHALQQLLARMGSGMQVALYTTLTGLGTAMLVGLQCHWLDRCADRLISNIIEMTALHAKGMTED